MRFGVLGPLAVWTTDGRPVRIPDAKVRALLADLLVYEGRLVSSDRLIDDLWGERLPRNPTGTLHSRVSQLRRVLESAESGGRGLVVSQPPGYLLRLEPEAVDAGRFASLVGRARAAVNVRERAKLLADALALWRGPAYADFADEDFARPVAARLEEEHLAALEEHAEARLALGEHGWLAGELGDLVARHPLRERLRALHMRALSRAGRQSEALESYADLRERLADELGLDPGPKLVAVHEAILRQDPALEGTAVAARQRTNLPAALAELIGREQAVSHVRTLLESGRLVTLTGAAGVGKTQLALKVARELEGGIPDGAWLVELAGLDRASGDSPASVAGVAASALGVRDDALRIRDEAGAAGDLLGRLADALRTRSLLLVLDNCEHVIESVAVAAEVLLRTAPGLRILATSQESLGLPGERLWAVPPLDLPDPAAEPEELRRFAAVELFVTRAAAAAPGFELGPANAAAVAAVCRRLDGIPLALELAAARVRALGVHELAARLDDRFRVLVAGRRGAPARQRTLRAMIDWSWELLSEPERVALRRLGVHADGCTLTAAEEVGSLDGTDGIDMLARLVDRSLVVMADGPDGPRYRLLESVRDYCLDRLREAGESDEIHHRHLRHYTGLAERAAPHLHGPDQRPWLERLDREWANLRAALDTTVRLADADAAARLVNALGWYWLLRGRLAEARRALDLALNVCDDARVAAWRTGVRLLMSDGTDADARAATSSHENIADMGARARAQWFLSYAHRGFTDLTVTSALLEQALDGFRELDDRWGVAAALSVRATIARARGDLAAAHRDALDSDELFKELGDRWGRVKATNTLAELAEIAGDYREAARLHREGLRMAEELSLWDEASFRLSGLGRIALLTGDLAAADAYHEQAMRLAAVQSNKVAEHFAEMGLALSARRRGEPELVESHLGKWVDWLRGVAGEPGLALALAELGFAAEQRGDAEAAVRLHLDGLASARKIGDPRAVALALEGLAGALTAEDPPRAAHLLGVAAALRESVGAPLPPAERGDVDRITAALRETLGDASFTAAFEHGTQLSPDHVIHTFEPGEIPTFQYFGY
ncbi:BTAD domain-containing putative transcriptional regulator [Nonomuraea basaltis]|uniref:BTAD domain-containing putative transcriptional regulator n=1 Tax=Nonomuraea basaltis TaxID=2495887 RepID=UPI00110C42D9|nr:BTAD domain-containing putative transcriptional regulator [Nonomuraea basaltis]TMR92323.1 AfsR/SARP family transcriptional regulator [Nonomuraea basaltis]